jgi:acyl-CoA dehydrogenase
MTTALTVEVPATYPPFTAEHDLIRQTVKRFCREEIAPFAEEWDEAGIFPRETLHAKLRRVGFVRHPHRSR